MAELGKAHAQADSLGSDNCPCGQWQRLGQWEHRKAEAGPEVPKLFLQLLQSLQCICLDLAPAQALLCAQFRGQGQAAGGCRNLLLH